MYKLDSSLNHVQVLQDTFRTVGFESVFTRSTLASYSAGISCSRDDYS